jgi:hypothetical protein
MKDLGYSRSGLPLSGFPNGSRQKISFGLVAVRRCMHHTKRSALHCGSNPAVVLRAARLDLLLRQLLLRVDVVNCAELNEL